MLSRTTLLATLAFAGLSSAGLSSGAHATTFDLNTAIGAAPTFSISSGGKTATFSSPAGNGFTVQNTSGLLSFSTALLDNNFFGTDPLTITFAAPVVDEILIPFAIQDAFGSALSTDILTVTTNTGRVRTFATASDMLPLAEPEGLVAFVPLTPITSLTLTSPIAFAIGNVSVPEPMSLSILGMGLAGLAALRRKQRAA